MPRCSVGASSFTPWPRPAHMLAPHPLVRLIHTPLFPSGVGYAPSCTSHRPSVPLFTRFVLLSLCRVFLLYSLASSFCRFVTFSYSPLTRLLLLCSLILWVGSTLSPRAVCVCMRAARSSDQRCGMNYAQRWTASIPPPMALISLVALIAPPWVRVLGRRL